MEALEPKKLALIRILQILKKYRDSLHLMTQEDIAQHLERDYGIIIERKAEKGWQMGRQSSYWL